jgi:TetR/AcrR family transcriptional repressor of nem operon
MKAAIIDSAQRRMQAGGFAGLSFREVASDVGVKSLSIHYHLPTKDDLGAAVIRRWTENTLANIDRMFGKEQDPVAVWTKAFRRTAYSAPHMCPCTVLAVSAHELPDKVTLEVKSFFRMCRDKMVSQGMTVEKATEFLAGITGAMVFAGAMRDSSEYDRATGSVGATGSSRKKKGSAHLPAPADAAVTP